MNNPLIPIGTALELSEQDNAVLLDCRWFLDGRDARSTYLEGHIPGARFLDMESVGADLSIQGRGRHPLPSVRRFADGLEDLGVSQDSIVVLYDSDSGTIAARIWWMTRQISIESYIIAGGIQSFTGTLESGETTYSRSNITTTKSSWDNSVTTDELIQHVSSDRRYIILDARNQDRYLGDFEPVDPRGGHIPGSYNLPTRTLMVDGVAPLPTDEIRERIRGLIGDENYDAVTNGEAEIVVSCGSGITACHLAIFVEDALGYQPILYNGSFSAWAQRNDLPVQTGKDRGYFPVN